MLLFPNFTVRLLEKDWSNGRHWFAFCGTQSSLICFVLFYFQFCITNHLCRRNISGECISSPVPPASSVLSSVVCSVPQVRYNGRTTLPIHLKRSKVPVQRRTIGMVAMVFYWQQEKSSSRRLAKLFPLVQKPLSRRLSESKCRWSRISQAISQLQEKVSSETGKTKPVRNIHHCDPLT